MKKPLYLRYAEVMVRGQLRKRLNLFLVGFSQLSSPLAGFLGILFLFSRFGTLAGYARDEVLLCFGLTHLSYSLAELSARGFDMFSQILAQGEFDRALVRPRGAMFQILASRLELTRLGRCLVGAAVLGWALADLLPGWVRDAAAAGQAPRLALRLGTLALMGAGGYAIFFGIFMLGAALAFLTSDSLEIVNILSDGGREMSQYPLTIYEKSFRRFFTFVVPFGCVNYLPLEFVLGRSSAPALVGLLPLAGFLFLLACALAWKAGARRYVSAGS